jgi:hypothetical protein
MCGAQACLHAHRISILALFEGEKITIQQPRIVRSQRSVKFDARNHTEFILWECARS